MEKVMESTQQIDFEQDGEEEEEERWCRELKLICKESEEKRSMLEAEIRELRKENEELERKIKLLEMEKLCLEEELKGLRDKNWECGQEKRQVIIDLPEESEENEMVQVLIENKVLECEKKKAEDDTKFWKARFKELESRFLNLDKTTRNRMDRRQPSLDMECGISTGFSPGTPPRATFLLDRVGIGREKISDQLQSWVRRQLDFKEEAGSSKKIAMSTPGSARHSLLGSADAADREDEPNISKPKRKRAAFVVKINAECQCEEEEEEYDGDIPISKMKRLNLDSEQASSELNGDSNHAATPKHRLRKAWTVKEHVVVEDDDLEEVGSENEGESLDGFIVKCSDASFNGYGDANSSEDLDGILSKIQRKNPELCTKAVCVLYQQRTSAEKISRSTINSNRRDFSHFDAFRGSILSELLTGGGSPGEVVKSAGEFRENDAEASSCPEN